MNYNTLGRTGLKVSNVGLGTWAFGNNVYGGVSEDEGINVIKHGYNNGINLFDTAPQYGTKEQDGIAEIVLGKALKGIRKDVIIQTKFGRNFSIENGAPQFYKNRIIASVEESLTRLQTDYIDVLFFHSPFSIDEIQDDVWEGVEIVKNAGKVRFIGHSISMLKNTQHMAMSWALENKIDVVQVVLSLMYRESEQLIKDLSKLKVGVVARECMANGFLSGNISKDTIFEAGTLNKRYTRQEIIERVEQVEKFDFLINEHISKMSQAAMRAVMDEAGVNTVLSGAKNMAELDDALLAANACAYTNTEIEKAKRVLSKNFEPA